MKKTILGWLLIQLTIAPVAFSMNNDDLPLTKKIQTGEFTSIIINADVVVQLLNSSNKEIQIEGDNLFLSSVMVIQNGNALIINSKKDKNFKNRGVILIPAAMVNFIQINNAANIKSSETLEIPTLDISVNGPCSITIANKGKLRMFGNERYDVQYELKEAGRPGVTRKRYKLPG